MPVVLAAPELVILALVAAILLYGLAQLLIYVIQAVGQDIPLIGNRAASWAQNLLQHAMQSASSWARSALAPLSTAIAAPAMHLDSYFGKVESGFQTVYGVLSRIVAQAVNLTAGAVQSMINDAVQTVQSWTQQQVTAVTQDLNQAGTDLRTYARDQAAAAEQQAQGAIAQAVQGLQQSLSTAEASIKSAAAAADQDAQKAIVLAQQALSDIGLVTSQLGGLSPVAVAQEVATAFDQAQEALTTQGAKLASEIASAAAAATAAGASTVAIEAALQQLITDCAEPMCSTFGGEMQLQGTLNNLISDGVILAVLAAIVVDPKGAAGDAAAALSGLAQESSQLIGQLRSAV